MPSATQRSGSARRSVTPVAALARDAPRTAPAVAASRTANAGSAATNSAVPSARGGPRTTVGDGSTGTGRVTGRDVSGTTPNDPTTLPNERESTVRNPSTIVNKALGDTNARLDGLQTSVDDALRDRDLQNDYGGGGFGVGVGVGYGAGYYDGGGYYDGFGGQGLGYGGGINAWSTFPDPCCMSGIASASAYCGLGGIGGFGVGTQMPCCVGGGEFVFHQIPPTVCPYNVHY